jgi:hypothetical protein
MSSCYARSDSSRARVAAYPPTGVPVAAWRSSGFPPMRPNCEPRRASARHRGTQQDRPLTELCQVRGRCAWWWRVEDSNLRSFRDGFTGRRRRLAPSSPRPRRALVGSATRRGDNGGDRRCFDRARRVSGDQVSDPRLTPAGPQRESRSIPIAGRRSCGRRGRRERSGSRPVALVVDLRRL